MRNDITSFDSYVITHNSPEALLARFKEEAEKATDIMNNYVEEVIDHLLSTYRFIFPARPDAEIRPQIRNLVVPPIDLQKKYMTAKDNLVALNTIEDKIIPDLSRELDLIVEEHSDEHTTAIQETKAYILDARENLKKIQKEHSKALDGYKLAEAQMSLHSISHIRGNRATTKDDLDKDHRLRSKVEDEYYSEYHTRQADKLNEFQVFTKNRTFDTDKYYKENEMVMKAARLLQQTDSASMGALLEDNEADKSDVPIENNEKMVDSIMQNFSNFSHNYELAYFQMQKILEDTGKQLDLNKFHRITSTLIENEGLVSSDFQPYTLVTMLALLKRDFIRTKENTQEYRDAANLVQELKSDNNEAWNAYKIIQQSLEDKYHKLDAQAKELK